MKKCFSLLAFLLLFMPIVSFAQNVVLNGRVTDKHTGEALCDAHIYFTKHKKGYRSNEQGEFKISLPAQPVYDMVISYVGYASKRMSISGTSDTLINVLLENNSLLSELAVYGSRNDFGVQHTQMSAIEMPIHRIEYVPAVFGEVDVMKALQTLPGVQSSSDGHAGIYVRGGGYDQNQITLDGATLYNAEHLKGLMSAINSDMVSNLVFYKGAFPARYGGQLSSVVDIEIKDGDMESYHGSATLGAMTSKIQFEGPIKRGKTSFNVAARASYLDFLVQPALKKVADNNNAMSPYADLKFYDVSAKMSHRISGKHKLSGFFYLGRDDGQESPSDGSVNTAKYNSENQTIETVYKNSNSSSANNWGNLLSSLSWEYLGNKDFSIKSTASYSQYDYYMMHQNYTNEHRAQVHSLTNDTLSKKVSDKTSLSEHDSYVNEYSFSVNADYSRSDTHRFRFGGKFSLQSLSPTVHLYNKKYLHYMKKAEYKVEENTTVTENDSIVGNQREKVFTSAIYAEDEIKVTDFLKVNLGLRYVMFGIEGKVYHSLEPRVSARWLANEQMSFKVSYARMAQAVHMLSSTNLVSPSDIWVPVTDNIPPMTSDQFAIGYNYEPCEGITLSVEGYYKEMRNLLEYKEGASYLTSGKEWDNIVTIGSGKAYGIEFYAQKDVGKTTGWLSYTWSRSLRTFDKPGEELNGGRSFYSGTDRRHNFNVVAMHKFSDRFDISLSWTLQSGRRGNVPTDAFLVGVEAETTTYGISQFSGNLMYGGILQDGVIGGFAPHESYKERNESKLPVTHRLDVSANYHIPHKIFDMKVESVFNISVYNLYNRFNVNSIYWGYSSYDNSPNEDPVLKGVCLLPIMPSISYTLKF